SLPRAPIPCPPPPLLHLVSAPRRFAVLHHHVACHRIRVESQTPGLLRVGNGSPWAAEIRKRAATLLAGPAVMTCGAAIMLPGEDGDAADGHHAAHFVHHRFAQHMLSASHFHSRKKDAVRQLRESFGVAANADVTLD